MALSTTVEKDRFTDSKEMTSAILRFPDNRLASFVCSFGASDTSSYRVIGTKGDIRIEPAYEYAADLVHYVNVDGKTSKKTFKKRDQFGPQLEYFSKCILSNKTPEPGGDEGLIDVSIVEAILESAITGKPVSLEQVAKNRRLEPEQEIQKPAVEEPELVHAQSPSGE